MQARGVSGTRNLFEGVVRREVTARNSNLTSVTGTAVRGLRLTPDKVAVTGDLIPP